MRKLFVLASVCLFLILGIAKADCGSTACYDHCTNNFLFVNGNECGLTFDVYRGCYHGYGKCVNDGNVDTCSQSVDCYDYCQNNYQYLEGDTCTYSGSAGCFAAGTSCSALPLIYPTTITVKGRVFDQRSHRPITNAVISLSLATSGSIGQGVSNGHGMYSATVNHPFAGRADVLHTCAAANGYKTQCYELSSTTSSVISPVSWLLIRQKRHK